MERDPDGQRNTGKLTEQLKQAQNRKISADRGGKHRPVSLLHAEGKKIVPDRGQEQERQKIRLSHRIEDQAGSNENIVFPAHLRDNEISKQGQRQKYI